MNYNTTIKKKSPLSVLDILIKIDISNNKVERLVPKLSNACIVL